MIVQIKTSELGWFKLMGHPVRNGVLSAKKMAAHVYESVGGIEVFITDSLTDHYQVNQPNMVYVYSEYIYMYYTSIDIILLS